MSPKWIGFVVAPAVAVVFGIATGLSLGQDQEKKDKEHETPLGKIMEKVQKHNIALTKATRTPAAFKKSQKDVEKLAKEMVKLAKDARPLSQDYLKNAKDEPNPKKKWEEIMDAFAKLSRGACRCRGEERRRSGSRENALYETRQGNLHRLPQRVPGGREQFLTPPEQCGYQAIDNDARQCSGSDPGS